MTWKELHLAHTDGHPDPGELCVVRRVYPDNSGGKTEYIVGRFVRDPRDPKSTKLWWVDGRGSWSENPARWKDRYCGMLWAVIDLPVEEVRE